MNWSHLKAIFNGHTGRVSDKAQLEKTVLSRNEGVEITDFVHVFRGSPEDSAS